MQEASDGLRSGGEDLEAYGFEPVRDIVLDGNVGTCEGEADAFLLGKITQGPGVLRGNVHAGGDGRDPPVAGGAEDLVTEIAFSQCFDEGMLAAAASHYQYLHIPIIPYPGGIFA